jgi:hypothetical protein
MPLRDTKVLSELVQLIIKKNIIAVVLFHQQFSLHERSIITNKCT